MTNSSKSNPTKIFRKSTIKKSTIIREIIVLNKDTNNKPLEAILFAIFQCLTLFFEFFVRYPYK